MFFRGDTEESADGDFVVSFDEIPQVGFNLSCFDVGQDINGLIDTF